MTKTKTVSMIYFAFILTLSCNTMNKPMSPVLDSQHVYISSFIGTKNFNISKSFSTSFETIDDFAGFYSVPQNYMSSSTHQLTDSIKHTDNLSHFGTIYATNTVIAGTNTNHRGYPTIQLYKRPQGIFYNMVFCEIWVRLNIKLENLTNKDWFSFATFTSYADDYWYRAYLVNLDKNSIIHLMHVPNQGQSVHDIYQTTSTVFPMNEWVKLSILIDYTSENEYNYPYIKVWQNEQLVSGATFNPRIDLKTVDSSLLPPCLSGWNGTDIAEAESLCSLNYTSGLAQAHFGLYAPPLLSEGEIWNDDLTIYEITK